MKTEDTTPKEAPHVHAWHTIVGSDGSQVMQVPGGCLVACDVGVTFVPGATIRGFELED